MSLRKIFFFLFLILSTLCLAAGYAIDRQWIGAMIAILAGLAWLLARKNPGSVLPHVCLLISVGLAVVGRLIGSPPFLMVSGSAVALAVWDLLLLDSSLGNNSSLEQTRQYENKHLQSLMLALGFGLLSILLGRAINLHTPFFVLMLFIIFILFALDRIWGYIKKTGKL
jgi:hypothetical protein